MTPASESVDESAIAPEDRDRAFQLRPVWQRFLVVLAGPAANFLLAIIIFAAFFTFVGAPLSNVIGAVEPRTAAGEAGLQPGDRVLAVDGRETPTFDDIRNVVALRPNAVVLIDVKRGDAVSRVRVTLKSDTFKDQFGKTQRKGLLGVAPTTTVLERLPLTKAVPEAIDYTGRLTFSIVDGIGQIFAGQISPKALGGPIAIAKVAGQGAALGPLPFVALLAFLSINLGFINLLPVPMLDGGHLFFYAIEAVRRRPLSAQALEWAFRGGLAVLLALVLFTTFNDLGSIGLWDRLQRLIG
jgi:regulator of sigma E protease